MDRICKSCDLPKPIGSFGLVRGRYRRRVCFACEEHQKRIVNPERMREAARSRRRSNRGTYILQDCRSSDRKKGLPGNNLDIAFVTTLISSVCTYCGCDTLKMTLDLIDNGLAHTKANVNPCCIRCNLIRGSMPYAAWLIIVPAVRQAYVAGYFGDWRSRPLNFRE